MTDWTEADLEQNRKLNEIAAKLEQVSERLDRFEARFAPLDRIHTLVESIWERIERLVK